MAKQSLLKRAAGALAILTLGFAGILVVGAATMQSEQLNAFPLPALQFTQDGEGIAATLASVVKRRTVSTSLDSPAPATELEALRADLAAAFPHAHKTLEQEVIGEHSLLYTWKGSKRSNSPIILCAHMDVVPVEPGTEAAWTHPPFDGVVEGGFVWGRGTLDDKASLIAILTAVEAMVVADFTPVRTVLLAFGHDEEISGRSGAARIAETLAARGVHAELALDEGSAIVEGVVTDVPAPVAAIGIAEKGYLSVDLKAELPGGHSSTPARENALTVLARAVERLQAEPMPARIDGATAQFLAWVAPEMRFGPRLALANMWVTAPLVRRMLATSPTLGAAIRTTTAVTLFHAGVKDNVVPAVATATVNFRILPGDTTDDVLAHVKRVTDDDRITFAPQASSRTEPSRVSRVDARGFELLAETVGQVFPGTVVAPSLVLGATDGRYYASVAENVYRFFPFRLRPEDIKRIHGKDERIAIESLVQAVRFYRLFLQEAARRE